MSEPRYPMGISWADYLFRDLLGPSGRVGEDVPAPPVKRPHTSKDCHCEGCELYDYTRDEGRGLK